tara:strand:+ start:3975 stop:4562 length:588 start_codon:yes stop_codon:yes gene_type:complete
MDLVKVTDGTPQRYSLEQFKRANPRTGFPDPLSAGDLAPYGVFPLRSSKPNYDPATQVLSDTGVALEDNDWVVQWVVIDLPATVANVITERQRRLAAGFTYDFTDARGVHTIGTTEADMNGWDEVSKAASALVALGLPDQAISIVTDTGPCDVTAIEWQSVLVSAMQFRQPIFAASFVLQSSDPIPQDYADDVNW